MTNLQDGFGEEGPDEEPGLDPDDVEADRGLRDDQSTLEPEGRQVGDLDETFLPRLRDVGSRTLKQNVVSSSSMLSSLSFL